MNHMDAPRTFSHLTTYHGDEKGCYAMRKTGLRTTVWLVLFLSLSLAGVAAGQSSGPQGGGIPGPVAQCVAPPAAPEPGILILSAIGVALSGGFVVWRRRKSNGRNNPE